MLEVSENVEDAPDAVATSLLPSLSLHPHAPNSQQLKHAPATRHNTKTVPGASPRKALMAHQTRESPRRKVPSEAIQRVIARNQAQVKHMQASMQRGSEQAGADNPFINRVHDVGHKILASFKHRIRPPAMGTLEVGGQEQSSPLLAFSWIDGLFDVLAAHSHKRGALDLPGCRLPHTVVIRNSRPFSWFFSADNSDTVHYSYEAEDLSPAILAKVYMRKLAPPSLPLCTIAKTFHNSMNYSR
jgi:hypothetical protein